MRTRKRNERSGRAEDGERYTDSRVDEQKRGLSIKAAPMTLLLQSSSEKRVPCPADGRAPSEERGVSSELAALSGTTFST